MGQRGSIVASGTCERGGRQHGRQALKYACSTVHLDRLVRPRQLGTKLSVSDPENIERRLRYDRAYYRKHRKRLLGMRAERYRKMKTLQNKETIKGGLQT